LGKHKKTVRILAVNVRTIVLAFLWYKQQVGRVLGKHIKLLYDRSLPRCEKLALPPRESRPTILYREEEYKMKNIVARLILIYLVFTVVGVVAGQTDVQASPAEAVVGAWPLDGTGTDASGNGHNGEIKGSPQWVTGKFGKAPDFLERKGISS